LIFRNLFCIYWCVNLWILLLFWF